MTIARSLGWSAAFAAAFLALYAVTVVLPAGQQVDARSLGLLNAESGLADSVFRWVRSGSVIVLALLATAAVIFALVRRQWGDAIFVVLGVGAITLATGWIRDDVLVRPAYAGLEHVMNSYPSRHVAVSVALCVAVVRLWPWPRSRATALIIGVAVVTVVALASVVTFAHRASDVIGGILLVGVAAPVFARFRTPIVRSALRARRSHRVTICAALVIGTVLACVQIWPVYALGLLVVLIAGSVATGVVVLRVGAARRAS